VPCRRLDPRIAAYSVLTGQGKKPVQAGATPDELEALGKKQAKKLDEILDDLSTNAVLIGRLADKIGAQAFLPLLKRDPTVDPLYKV
jgi:hypothetical protein